jgi:FAD/FMN-containing dehydrogenase
MSAGYDLTRLFVGSEGTLGIITKARLKVRPLPESRSMLVSYFDELENAGRAAVSVLSSGVLPAAMEILDGSAIHAVQQVEPGLGVPDAEAMLLFELDGYKESVARQVDMVSSACEKCGGRTRVARRREEEEKLWTTRRLVSIVIMKLEPGKVSIYEAEDLGIPMSKVPFMLKKIREVGRKHGLTIVTFGHIGDGDLHTGIAIDLSSQEEWSRVHAAKDDLYDVVLSLGGTLSGEHGIGVIRGSYMSRSCGKGYEVMKTIKRAIDPCNIMNPGKMGM